MGTFDGTWSTSNFGTVTITTKGASVNLACDPSTFGPFNGTVGGSPQVLTVNFGETWGTQVGTLSPGEVQQIGWKRQGPGADLPSWTIP